jgi:hypothetical protein
VSAPTTTLAIPTREGANAAPIKPLLSLKERSPQPSSYIADAIREKFNHYLNQNKSVWEEMFGVGEMIDLFIQGKQLLRPNPYQAGGLIPIPATNANSNQQRILNMMQFYAMCIEAKWKNSNPDILVLPGNDKEKSIAASKAGKAVVDYYERQFYKPWFNRKEAGLAMRYGTYLTRIRHDPGIKGIVGLRDVIQQKPFRLEGHGYCGDCGTHGEAKDFLSQAEPISEPEPLSDHPYDERAQALTAPVPRCPKCGRTQSVLLEQPPEIQVPNVAGQERVEMGDFRCDQLPFSSCRWDLNKRAEESGWFITQTQVDVSAIRRLLGDVRLPGEPGDDRGLQSIQRLAHAGQALYGSSNNSKGSAYKDPATVAEFWLSADDLYDIKLRGGEQTVSGEELPAGSLADTYPNGAVFVGINGMSVLTGIHAEQHKSQIISGVWHMRPLSGAGRGIADTVEVQKRQNVMDSQQLTYFSTSATPAIGHLAGIIKSDEARYLGKPNLNVPIQANKLPDGWKIPDAFYQFTPQSVPGQFVQYVQQFLAQQFQFSTGVLDFTDGQPGVNNKTATGAQITAARSDAVYGPILEGKAEVRQRCAEIIVELYRKHMPLKRYFPLGGKHGRQQGIWLSGADLKAELIYEVVEDSEMPRHPYSKKQDLMAMFETTGGAKGLLELLQVNPPLATEILRRFNIELDSVDDYDEIGQLCRSRFDQMQQLFESGIPDPIVLTQSIKPPVSMLEPQHPVKAKWWMDFLDDDDALQAPMELRLAIEEMVKLHFRYNGEQEAAKAGQAGEVQVAGAVPGEVAGAIKEQIAGQGQPAPQAAQTEMRAQEAEAQRQHEAERLAAEQQHETEQQASQQEHELTTKAIDVLAQQEQARIAARQKGASK